MVAVRTKFLASLVAFALVAGPASLGAAGAELETVEPDCYPAEDGSGAYVCEFPSTCEEDLDGACDLAASCELIDDNVVRCAPSDENETEGNLSLSAEAGEGEPSLSDLIQPPEEAPDEDKLGQPMAKCGIDNDTHQLVCEPPAECQETDSPDYCQPPDECEAAADGLYRCDPGRGQALPGQAQERRQSENRSGQEPGSSAAEGEPACEPASERGVVICTPPASCLDRLGETPECTPPPECEERGDGTFRCQIPDRVKTGADPADGNETPFAGVDPEARADARAEIARGIHDAADGFRSDLQDMRADYEQRLDGLKDEYQDAKDELRSDYEACREEIPANATADERNEALQACLQQAREGLASLRTDMRERHEALKQTFTDRAEEARQDACTEAENVALDAVARHGLFTANPADLVPDRALELCPSFADFDRGGELG